MRFLALALGSSWLAMAVPAQASETTDTNARMGDTGEGPLDLKDALLNTVPVALSVADLARADAPMAAAFGRHAAAHLPGTLDLGIPEPDPSMENAASQDSDAGSAVGMSDNAAAIDAAAMAGDEALFAGAQAERVSDDDLAEQRGGFRFGGLDISFGAEIRSYLGDELVFQTNLSFTDGAADIQRVVSSTLSAATAAELGADILAGNGVSLKLGEDSVFVGNQGQTAFIQRTEGSLQNVIINSANNVVLRQQIDATLDVSNFAPFRSGILDNRIGESLSNMVGQAISAGFK